MLHDGIGIYTVHFLLLGKRISPVLLFTDDSRNKVSDQNLTQE